ncbi:S8 family serine peptidase [Actinophytocola sp.]|uniref:S8 family serine peptidase n=1 Tax=Actinophytocola sp. TaxID=1872138 RepID=UPI002ED162A4
MTHRRARLSLLSAAVAAGVVASVMGVAPGAAGAVAAPGAVGPTVTLLTGDKVTIGGMRGVSVQAAKGREHIAFYTRTDEQGDTHVVPSDVVPLLSAGKLDSRLFDVTELVRVGYDDASRDRLPLIVDYPGRTPRMAGAQVSRELPGMSAAAVSVERSADFWATARNAEAIWLDGPVRASLDQSVKQIGAPEAWAAGNTGAGVTVAVLDTGIDAEHPDLADAVVDARNFTDSDTADDRAGHGTHVASIITGNSDKYRGVAPDAKLLNGKVLSDALEGQESWIIAGMEWAVAGGADVVNMSLGSRYPTDGTDPIAQTVNRLTEETGTLFVVSAGNTGGPVGSPGSADAALTVGAVDRDDSLAAFSSRGREGGGLKPDITAPGVNIMAARAGTDGHVGMLGTSMAAPHVAGAAAVLAGQHPKWTADQLKPALMGSAKPNGAIPEQGAGRVDVAKASAGTVFASVASIDNGTVRWPHGDDEPIEKAITYTNTGAAPVTLDFAADVPGAPQGMFTFSPAKLTVPAGGQATATVVTDTRVEAADGYYLGRINATGGGQEVRTLIAVTREAESYDMTVKLVDHDGAPTDKYFYQFVDLETARTHTAYDPSGTVVVRMPKGEYFLEATVSTPVGDRAKHAVFAEPALTVAGDSEFVADAREAKPVTFTLDKPNARGGDGLFQVHAKVPTGIAGSTAFIENFENFSFKPSTTSRKDGFTFVAELRMAEWNGTSFDGSPYLFNVRHTENGSVPRTLQWRLRDSQLAKVRSAHAAATPGMVGVRERFLAVPLPTTLTEYFTPDVPWDNRFEEIPGPYQYPAVSTVEQLQPKTYRLGRTTTERWNMGVYGPAFPGTNSRHGGWYWAGRVGRNLNFDLPLATDQGRGRMGFGAAEGSLTLLRDGEVLGESPYAGSGSFQVTQMPGVYTLRATADRSARARLSTQISAEWTFASQYVSDELVHLPLLALRFAPDLDGHNAAPAGKRFTIPVYVQRNGAEVGQVNTPSVEVSYDDGATWQAASVSRHRGEWKATVDHPAGAGFVSLRSTITDPNGNAQRQTIIRAYELK